MAAFTKKTRQDEFRQIHTDRGPTRHVTDGTPAVGIAAVDTLTAATVAVGVAVCREVPAENDFQSTHPDKATAVSASTVTNLAHSIAINPHHKIQIKVEIGALKVLR